MSSGLPFMRRIISETQTLEVKVRMKTSTKFQHPFLAGMDPKNREIFLHGAEEKNFAAGEVIFREGEPANALFLIQSGEVALESRSTGNTTLIQTLGDGDVLGWSWLFPPFYWHFQARATQPTRAICCDGGHLLVQAEEHPEFGYDVMRRITQIVIQRLQTTRKQLVRQESLIHEACAAR
ncbi:MAG: cyclic nucleotide-binding domain-containing protein [Verrucomicrobiota bacterium]|nr:cyclic nucleotide-binding domain-containing protein [Verrucomicrobiota bacterium]